MNPFLVIALLAVDPPPVSEKPKPVAVTRNQEKDFLENHKTARPRLPMPPAGTGPLARVNNGRFRQYYLPADFQFGGLGGRGDTDTELTLDNTFKVKLFWITSRANNCYYCLGHQEHKLASAGVTDDGIAALDSDWAIFTPAEQAAFAFTKKLTYEPNKVNAKDIEDLKKHYTPNQILEMTIAVAGFNSMNRWTDGLNIPGEENGNFFRKEGGPDLSGFKTPTSAKYAEAITSVAPIDQQTKSCEAPCVPARPALESAEAVNQALEQAKTRKATLPVAKTLPANWDAKGKAPQWALLMATFTKSGKSRYDGVNAVAEKGSLSPKLKAAIAWSAARTDRAWYALGVAKERLKALGLTEEQIFGLDTDAAALEPADRQALALAKKLALSSATVSDADVEAVRKGGMTDKQVAEVVHHACTAAFFDRVTEAANLPLD